MLIALYCLISKESNETTCQTLTKRSTDCQTGSWKVRPLSVACKLYVCWTSRHLCIPRMLQERQNKSCGTDILWNIHLQMRVFFELKSRPCNLMSQCWSLRAASVVHWLKRKPSFNSPFALALLDSFKLASISFAFMCFHTCTHMCMCMLAHTHTFNLKCKDNNDGLT